VDRELDDVNSVPVALHPDDYTASQIEGRELHAAGSYGLLWNSVRMPGQRCICIFWPDAITIPVQGRHYCYRQYRPGVVLPHEIHPHAVPAIA
ncbi:RES family NAD+ phosphorylase, partial [Rhizobium ruizarguesonis]